MTAGSLVRIFESSGTSFCVKLVCFSSERRGHVGVIWEKFTWSRVFTMAKKVTRVATLTANIRVLVNTNCEISFISVYKHKPKNVYRNTGEKHPLNFGIIDRFTKARNRVESAFLDLSSPTIN